jgi:ABC-2 type transport system permease protein
VMRHTIFANLLGNDPEKLARASTPMEVEITPLFPETTPSPGDHPAAFYIPYATMMILYLAILMSASLLLNSVSNEKKNRVMEVLLLSVAPRQMLLGKITGLGVLGLLQTVIWLGTGYGLLRLGGNSLSLPAGLALPPSILVWGIAFFLLGYAVYASLMAGLGALVPNLREASQAVIIVIWPLLIPIFFLPVLIEKSHGVLATVLSIFPLTAPIAMMARLAKGALPVWQPMLSAVLMAFMAALVIRAASAMFHARNLLSGQPFSARHFLRELFRGERG